MTIPKKVPIQGVDWIVEIVDELTDELGRPAYGLCEPEGKKIILLKTDKKLMLATFYHEVMHCICEQSGFHQAYDYNMNYEEILCEQFSNFLMSDAVKLSFKK